MLARDLQSHRTSNCPVSMLSTAVALEVGGVGGQPLAHRAGYRNLEPASAWGSDKSDSERIKRYLLINAGRRQQ